MRVVVVGKVDGGWVVEEIKKRFGEVKGKGERGGGVGRVCGVGGEGVSIMSEGVGEEGLCMMWDRGWEGIGE